MTEFKLSAQQQAVHDFVVNGTGSANVEARAGCGKTFTLVQGVIKPIVENSLGELAIMAFNKSAAEEFSQRINVLANGDSRYKWPKVAAGTVHSFGLGAVRKWSRTVKIDGNKVHEILKMLARLDPTVDLNSQDVSIYERESGSLTKLVSLAKQSGIGFLTNIQDVRAWHDLINHHDIDSDHDTNSDALVQAAIVTLQASIKQDKEIIDFDDMIFCPLYHNLTFYQKDWVLIDEAQDTNPARRALALKMLKPNGRLIAVGDDRQAIYGFTGADANALDLIADEVNAVRLPLTVTYRCPKAVVKSANRLVPDLEAHETAPEGVVRSIPRVSKDKKEFFVTEALTGADAVLCRNVAPLLDLAYSMLGAGHPCMLEGRDIGEGLIKLATRWKSVHTLGQLCEKLRDWKDREVQKWQAKDKPMMAQAAEDKANALRYIASALMSDGFVDVADLVTWVRELFAGGKENATTLTTVHKSKGREWPRVFILERAKTMPSKWAKKDWQLKQEANLEYVAITRAESELVFVDSPPEQ